MKYKMRVCSICDKKLSELEFLRCKYNGIAYCEQHFPLETFVCEECGTKLILKFKIRSENIKICRRCLCDLVENDRILCREE